MHSFVIDFLLNNNFIWLYIFVPLFFLHLINCILERKHTKKKNNISKDKKAEKPNFSNIYIIIIVLITLIFLINIPIFKYFIIIINCSFLFYMLIFVPLFNKETNYNFIESNTLASSLLLSEVSAIIIKINTSFFDNMKTSRLVQSFMIILLLILTFLIIYIFLINVRMIFYYCSNNTLNKLDKKIINLVDYINNKHNPDLMHKKRISKKNTIFAFFEITKQIISFTIFVIVLNSILFAIHYFLKVFIDTFSDIHNNYIYTISKISLVITILLTYVIIQTSNEFNQNIITSYEFLSSTIVIPLLLEGFINNKKRLHQ